MKALFILIFIAVFPDKNDGYEKFIRIIPKNWSYKIDNNIFRIIKNDSIETYYCGYNSISWEDTARMSYEITIERLSKLSRTEIKKRKFLETSKLVWLKIRYRLKRNMSNAGNLMAFRFDRNRTSKFRIPFYNDKNYSYFIKNNFPWGNCYKTDSVKSEIDIVNITFLKIK